MEFCKRFVTIARSLVIVAALPLLGCGDDTKPSRSSAESQIGAYCKNNVQALYLANDLDRAGFWLALRRFKPHDFDYVTCGAIDYENGSQNDANHYVVLAKINLVYVKASRQLRDEFEHSAPASADPLARRMLQDSESALDREAFEAGKSVSVEASFSFLKTEKGWMLEQ
jgi:hypothetical protein